MKHLAELVDAAAISADRWQDVCVGFQEFFPEGRVLMQGYDTAAPYAMPLAGAGWDDINFDDYFAHFAAINPWVPAWGQLPVMTAILSDAVFPRKLLERTIFFNEWIKPLSGADSASGIKVIQERDRLAYFCVHYDGRDAERSHVALAPVFSALAPRMRRALDCNRVVLRRQSTIKSGSLMHDLLDPALIVDRDCRVLGANAAAEALMGERRFVGIRAGDKLSFDDQAAQQSLSKAVFSVCARLPGSVGLHEFHVGRLSVSVLPLTQNLREFAMRGPLGLFAPGMMALVIMRTQQERSSDLIAALRERYSFSEQEARVALALRGGGSLPAIAAQLGMSYETARVHIKACFAKAGVHRQTELLALVLEMSHRNG